MHDPFLNESFMVDAPKAARPLRIGNLNLLKRPMVPNPHGGTSTVDSVSFGVGGHEVLVPQVVGNRIVSARQALLHYLQTGENLGTFKSPAQANKYAELLHQQQAAYYLGG
jgi:hypothetical protein